jgi:cytochrome P450
VIKERRTAPTDDVVGRLVEHPELTDQEVFGLINAIHNGGVVFASAWPIQHGLLELARHQSLQRALRENPYRQRGFIEEVLRLDGGAKTATRVTRRDVTVADTTIPAESTILLFTAAVARDESDTLSGHEFIVDGPHRHWSFGGGSHRCPGSHLARAILNVFFAEWLDRMPQFELNEYVAPPAWYPTRTDLSDIYGLCELPLRWRVT